MNLGYDYIVIETNDIVSFLKETKKHQLTLFHLHQLDALRYSFYVPIYQRYITSSIYNQETSIHSYYLYLLDIYFLSLNFHKSFLHSLL